MSEHPESPPRDGAARSPETVDRFIVGVCGAIWLVLLVVAVIATVALVNLGRGGAPRAGESSSWLLYTIIGVSAATILAAIPLLLRARRTAAGAHSAGAGEGSAPALAARPAADPAIDAPTEKMRVFGATVDPYGPEPTPAAPSPVAGALDRLWLRGTASILGAIGLALIGTSTATYLLAVHSDTAAIVALALAGVITLGMPAILIAFFRRLSETLR